MKYSLFLYLASYLIAQEINPIGPTDIASIQFITSMDQYQNSLFLITFAPQNLYELDLGTGNLSQSSQFEVQSMETAYDHTLRIHNQTLFLGFYDLQQKYFFTYDANNIQTGHQRINTTNSVICFEFFDEFLFVGTRGGIEKFDLNTLERLELVSSFSKVNDLLKCKESLIVATFPMHERNLYNLTQITFSYQALSTNIIPNKLALNEKFIFSVYDLYIDLWVLSSNATFTLKPLTTKSNSDSRLLSSPSFEFNTLYLVIIYSVLAFLLLFGLAIFIYFILWRKIQKNENEKNSISKTTTSTTTSIWTTTNDSSSLSTQAASSFETQTFTETNNTLVGTKNAYSIPGYLEIQSNHIRIIKKIAKGGQGTVSLAEILDTSFNQLHQIKQVIVKSTEKKFVELSERQKNVFNQELAIIHYFKDRPALLSCMDIPWNLLV